MISEHKLMAMKCVYLPLTYNKTFNIDIICKGFLNNKSFIISYDIKTLKLK